MVPAGPGGDADSDSDSSSEESEVYSVASGAAEDVRVCEGLAWGDDVMMCVAVMLLHRSLSVWMTR